MRMIKPADHLGFTLKSSEILGTVLIPKYYNPEIQSDLDVLAKTHYLLSVGELEDKGEIEASTGHEIGKLAYGTGSIPFVRTSDISNWELKIDVKQGVSKEIYAEYDKVQDVQPGDVLFVRDGTYLIGEVCLVSDHDLPLLYQSHIIKFRPKQNGFLSGPLLLAALSAPIVRRQIRAKQFTADIIDTIGNRYRELILPIPKNQALAAKIEHEVQELTKERAQLRETLKRFPYLAQGQIKSLSAPLPKEKEWKSTDERNLGFIFQEKDIYNNIFLPRYYAPLVNSDLNELKKSHMLVTIGELVKQDVVASDTGIEVGKMAYGTGPIPFIRTSDISNWELKMGPKQCVSEELYEKFKGKMDVQAEDIFVVRDGTYLVGVSCILTKQDTKILYCGGLYKLRVKRRETIDPYLLLVLLNTPIVRNQMKAKQFTRDIIDTLGKRLFEIVLPIPKNTELCKEIARKARETVERRTVLRKRVKEIASELGS